MHSQILELWLQYIKDETSVLSDDGDREPIYALFKRAVLDYQSEFLVCYYVLIFQ